VNVVSLNRGPMHLEYRYGLSDLKKL
jgi:hypothetical protein